LTLSYPRQIFVNRRLALADIAAIGFDMDYTLCRYLPEMAVLATELAIERLVRRGYPEALRDVRFDPTWGTRGLVIDCAKGNVVKMDAHRHVARVWHGLKAIDDEVRREVYHADPPRLSGDRWAMTDTLFSTPESYLYCHLIEALERDAGGPLDSHETRRLYADIRYCIDLVHRDDSLKSRVRDDMDRYIERDPHLAVALHRLRSAGKTLFLLTNSSLDYTESVMSHLLDTQIEGYGRWQDYFECIWVTARKPHFFDNRDEPLQIGDKVFEQGGRRHLERNLGVDGDRILYVGDHIYGDVLKSRSTTGWRTALILPELESEVAALQRETETIKRRASLERVRSDLETRLASAELRLRGIRRAERKLEQALSPDSDADQALTGELPELADLATEREQLRQQVAELRTDLAANTVEVRTLSEQIERHFNPRWGQLLKERHKHSLFGSQMQAYACLYTSRVSNFAAYSPTHKFRPPRDLLPHERIPISESNAAKPTH
jgi:HAD superfamily 5'-nucleotidase-like hydrolase